jgi:uncharacterized protein (DUF433 family)
MIIGRRSQSHGLAGPLDLDPIFTGTRVPRQALFDYIEGGDSLGEFLEDLPDASREEHAIAVLEFVRTAAIAQSKTAAE